MAFQPLLKCLFLIVFTFIGQGGEGAGTLARAEKRGLTEEAVMQPPAPFAAQP